MSSRPRPYALILRGPCSPLQVRITRSRLSQFLKGSTNLVSDHIPHTVRLGFDSLMIFVQGTFCSWLYSPYWPSSWPFYTKCTSDHNLGSSVIEFLCSVYACLFLFFIEVLLFHGAPLGPVSEIDNIIMMGVYFLRVHPCNKRVFFSFGAAQWR